jgi:hypothetical protein
MAGLDVVSFGIAIGSSFGGRNSVGLLFVSFIFCIFIGLRFRADDFQIPPHRQAVSVVRHHKLIFKPTILNIATGVFILVCIFYTVINYQQLSEGEGWGVVGMVGLLGVGLVLLVIDFIIQKIFKSRKTINIICAIVTIAATLLLLLK